MGMMGAAQHQEKLGATQAPLRFGLTALLIGNLCLAFGPVFVRMADTGPVASAFWRIALAIVPLFVIAFLVLAGLHSLVTIPAQFLDMARNLSLALLLLAVTATGIRSPMQQLLEQGWRASVPVIVATLVSFAFALLAAVTLVQ